MSIQRTVICNTKGFREDKDGPAYWLVFIGPDPEQPGNADPNAPRRSGEHYHLDNVSRELFESYSVGGTYTLTIG